jgi:Ser/Thr protein kinase RdoA (MazF antagonist)
MFPTMYSTLDPDALGRWFEQHYRRRGVCEFLLRGVGDTYRINTNDASFILRIYRSSHRSFSQISAEVELLLAAKNAGVSVSYPVVDANGGYVQEFEAAEGRRHGVLFSYAPGRIVPVLNDEQLRHLGQEVARFHNVSVGRWLGEGRWNYDLQTTLVRPLELMEPYFAELPEEYAWWRKTAERIVRRMDAVDTSGFSSGYCHFDLLPQNFHFEGDRPTLFDFDFAGHGWLIYDLAIFRVHLDLDVQFGKQTKEAADTAFECFLSAYAEIRPISAAERDCIPWCMLSFWCFYMGFHRTHDQFYPLVQPGQLKARTALIRKLTEARLGDGAVGG